MRHPSYFFGRSAESAVIDPENPYVLAGQLACAAYELPLSDAIRAVRRSGARGRGGARRERQARRARGRRFWSAPEIPARAVNLRTISDDTYTILEAGPEGRVVGTVDAISGLELVYPEAMYLHEGETYVVRRLDLEQKVAFVEPLAVDYYTQPVLENSLIVLREERRRAPEDVEPRDTPASPALDIAGRASRSSPSASSRSAGRRWG